jgi:hypothetical protein
MGPAWELKSDSQLLNRLDGTGVLALHYHAIMVGRRLDQELGMHKEEFYLAFSTRANGFGDSVSVIFGTKWILYVLFVIHGLCSRNSLAQSINHSVGARNSMWETLRLHLSLSYCMYSLAFLTRLAQYTIHILSQMVLSDYHDGY